MNEEELKVSRSQQLMSACGLRGERTGGDRVECNEETTDPFSRDVAVVCQSGIFIRISVACIEEDI